MDMVDLVKVKGHVRLEIRNAHTGRLEDSDEGDNGITNYGAALFVLKMKAALMMNNGFLPQLIYGTNGEIIVDAGGHLYNLVDVFRSIALSDDDTTFSASEARFLGNLTGINYHNTAPDANALQGTFNIAESKNEMGSMKFVIDFPTDRGIGTHKSIQLCSTTVPAAPGLWPSNALDYSNRILLPYTGWGNGQIVSMDESYVYFISSYDAKIRKFIKTTGQFVSEIATSGASFSSHDAGQWCNTLYNGYVYFYENGNGKFFKVNLTTGVVTEITSATHITNTRLFVRVGSYISYIYNQTIYRFDLDAETVSSKTLPGNPWQAIGLKNGVIYLSDSSTGIYTYDWATNTRTLVSSKIRFNSYRTYWDFGNPTWPQQMFTDGTDWYMMKRCGDPYLTTLGATGTIYGAKIVKIDLLRAYDCVVAKRVFDSPKVKTNQQTMKATYTLNFS